MVKPCRLCGKSHPGIKHWALNLKLYEIRTADLEAKKATLGSKTKKLARAIAGEPEEVDVK